MIEVTEQSRSHSSTDTPKPSVHMVNSCEDCRLADVCKFVDTYHQYMYEVRKIVVPDIIKTEIACTFYQNEHLAGPAVKHSEAIYVR